jgi:hypothetical protein
VRRDGRSAVYRLERDQLQRVLGGWLTMLQPPPDDSIWRSPGARSTRRGTSE